MSFDVWARFEGLRATRPELRLYALVDGFRYEEPEEGPTLEQGAATRALFVGTPDAALAFAGPWLVDIERVESELVKRLSALEQQAPAVTWLITPMGLEGLALLLQLKLDARLPDGRTALVRFWDPRILAVLAEQLGPGQREEFFGHITEWHLLHEGQRVWIGRHLANAH
jgi:hypothetical protein